MAPEKPTHTDWTIMFYFATDNELSALNISQIKAVKEAGYQKSSELLLYFDSNEKGVPTRLFNMNKSLKGDPPTKTRIGDGRDPFVRSFLNDEILLKNMDRQTGPCTAKLLQALQEPDSLTAAESLANFIGYCRENSPAKHYMLFLIGHGLIVGNDTFLPDSEPRSAISLVQLGKILNDFKTDLKGDGELDLIGFHSCSMSAIEVACELKNAANYMIASEGFSYVGSWPYRQLMKKIFNTTEKGLTDGSVQALMASIYELSLHNAPDFAYSGYSHDLTLCSLAGDKLDQLLIPLRSLVDNLKDSITRPRGKELILLAHLKSQSFWGETYTDLFDFCRCLADNCDLTDPLQKSLADDCENVKNAIDPKGFGGLVVFSDNFGWEYQYARGLSIYFPWSEPLGEEGNNPVSNYKKYAFNQALGDGHSWLSFLEAYWKATMRPVDTNRSTQPFDQMLDASPESAIFESFNDDTRGRFRNSIRRLGSLGLDPNKPTGSVGSDCGCTSIKNFPTEVKLKRRIRILSATGGVAGAFDQSEDGEARPGDNEEQ